LPAGVAEDKRGADRDRTRPSPLAQLRLVPYSTGDMIRHIVQFLGYALATIIVIGGTALLIAYGNGDSYNFKTGHLIHRGLIIVGTAPSGASITINGKTISQRTTYQQSFRRGWYDFTLTKTGYRTWTRRIESIPSEATLVQYILLLPNHLVSATLATRAAITQFTASPDHSRIAFVVPSGSDAGLWSFNTSNNQQTKLYASAAATAATPAETVTVLSWSNDSNHLLIRSVTGATTTLLVVPAGGGQPVNLTALGVTTGAVTFSASNWQQLYWQSPDGLRRVDLSASTVSSPLATHVAAYTFDGGRLLYVDNTPGKSASLWSLSGGGPAQKLISKLAPSSSYQVAFASYLGVPEAMVVAQDSHTATLYRNLYGQPMTTKTLPVSATQALFNGNGRFVVLYDASHVATYDQQMATTYTLPPADSTVTDLTWFDDYHLLFTRGNQVVLSEFDGNYATALIQGDGQESSSTPNGKTVLATTPAANSATAIKAVTVQQ
jgi:hypothetical protein